MSKIKFSQLPAGGASSNSLSLACISLWNGSTYTSQQVTIAQLFSLAVGTPINEAQGADIASAATVNIGAATGNYVKITGAVTITAFDTVQAGTRRVVTFNGALTLTHNSISLILPGSANITTVAGDCAEFISLGSGNWVCVNYSKANTTGTGSTVYSTSPTFTTKITTPELDISGTGGAGFANFVAQSSNPSAPSATGFNLFAHSSGGLCWAKKNGSDTYVRQLTSTLTADRAFTFQDKSYIVAAVGDGQPMLIDASNFTPASGTNTTNEELLMSLQIPANKYASGNVIEIYSEWNFTNNANTKTIRCYFNTSNSLSGATLVGTLVTSGNAGDNFARFFPIISDTSVNAFGGASTSIRNQYGIGGASSNITIPSVSAGFWILFSCQKATGTDTDTIRYAMSSNYSS